MSDNGQGYDGATAVGDHRDAGHATAAAAAGPSGSSGPAMFTSTTKSGFKPDRGAFLKPHYDNGGVPSSKTTENAENLPFVDSSAYLSVKRPFLVPTGKDGVRGALLAVNEELVRAGHDPIISTKKPGKIIGREVNPGSFGLYEYASQPRILLQPGNYPGFPLGNWIGCTYFGTFDLSSNFPPMAYSSAHGLMKPDDKLSKLGLSIVQVSQNQAAVCLDPQNQVFVVNDGGFVAVAQTGAYRTLGLVDMTHLSDKVVDKYTKQILGHTQQVKLPGGYVAAMFLDIPANNVAILQRKDELYQLGAGQHYLTTASVTCRGFFTKGEVQQELECHNIYTRDQVPVWLRMYLRYELQNPLSLAKHGYETPFDSLQDKTRSILTQILAHLDYSAMARSRNAAPDSVGHVDDDDVNSVFVSAVRTQATDELKVAAAEYGILLHDLAIIDRKFSGDIARKMDELTTRALEAQVESANLDRENANRRLKEQGNARVLELQNAMKQATAETEASNVIAAARARAEALTIEAQAKATALRMTAEAEAEAVRTKARADEDISNIFAQELARARIEVERTRAFGDRTTFAPMEAMSTSGGIVGSASFGMLASQSQSQSQAAAANRTGQQAR